MTVYGDLDVSVLDELPPGRTPITTTWARTALDEVGVANIHITVHSEKGHDGPDISIAGTITIGFIFGAYMTETFRGAILAVNRGQLEAGNAAASEQLLPIVYQELRSLAGQDRTRQRNRAVASFASNCLCQQNMAPGHGCWCLISSALSWLKNGIWPRFSFCLADWPGSWCANPLR